MSLNIGAVKVQAFEHCRNTFASTTKAVKRPVIKLAQSTQQTVNNQSSGFLKTAINFVRNVISK